MRKLIWIAIVSVVLAGCAAPAPTSTPLPTKAPTRTPAATSTPTPSPTQMPVPTLTPTTAPTQTPAPAPTATQPSAAIGPLTLTAEELVGIWKAGDEGYIEVKGDGTWALAAYPMYLEAGKYDYEGKFSVERDRLSVSDTAICQDVAGEYQLESKTEDKLTFALVKDDCRTPDKDDFSTSFRRWAVFTSPLERVPQSTGG